MSKQIDALKLALEALEYAQADRECPSTTRQAITAIKEALAQPEQEPTEVDCLHCGGSGINPETVYGSKISCMQCDGKQLYVDAPQRKPLTREIIDRDFHGRVDFVRQVEAAHGIKE